MTTLSSPTIPDIKKLFTKKVRSGHGANYGRTLWGCNHCEYETTIYYEDFSNARAHARRMHRREYYSTIEFIINEEADHLWSLAK